MFDAGLDELNTVVKYLASFGVPETHFAVDLTIARGLDYYTGTVYETTMLDHPEIGSICSGGRYDNLAEYYTEKQLPGVGISIGLTRLFFVLEDQGYLNDGLNTAPADVLILPMTVTSPPPSPWLPSCGRPASAPRSTPSKRSSSRRSPTPISCPSPTPYSWGRMRSPPACAP